MNMPSWSTYEIELLIREIEEMQCFWNICSPEYKHRIKKNKMFEKKSWKF